MKKMNLCLMIALFICVNLFSDGVQPTGAGTEENPYQVSNLDNLLWLSTNSNYWDKHFVQTANIDASDTENWNSGEGFTPIGGDEMEMELSFTGSYNGLNHTIDSLYINRPFSMSQGFFGSVDGAVIEDLGITNTTVIGGEQVGGLIGVSNYSSTITNCYTSGNVSSSGSTAGGLIGMNSSTVNDCYSSTNVSSNVEFGEWGDSGGLIGVADYCSINNCYSNGNVNGNNNTGGLVGYVVMSTIVNSHYNYDTVLINGENVITIGALDSVLFQTWLNNDLYLNIDDYFSSNGEDYLISSNDDLRKLFAFGQFSEYSFLLTSNLDLSSETDFYIPYFAGSFKGNNYVINNININLSSFSNLGFFGYTNGATIENLGVANVNVNGQSKVGGLIGNNTDNSIFNNCYSSGIVIGSYCVGGLIGFNENSTVSNCYSSANVNTTNIGSRIGGLVGRNDRTSINNSYSTGNVNGSLQVGGLIGGNFSHSLISNCYSTSSVSGTDSLIGGLVGVNNYYSTLNNCYSTGNVQGSGFFGGLVGRSFDHSFVSNSFWNIETSGQTTSNGGTGKTSAEMINVATYTDTGTNGLTTAWDFVNNPNDDLENEDYWNIDGTNNGGYPYLVSERKSSTSSMTMFYIPYGVAIFSRK